MTASPIKYGAFVMSNRIACLPNGEHNPIKIYRVGPFDDLEAASAARDLIWGRTGWPSGLINASPVLIAFVDYWDGPSNRGDRVFQWDGDFEGEMLP